MDNQDLDLRVMARLDWAIGRVGIGYMPDDNQEDQLMGDLARHTHKIPGYNKDSADFLLPFTCMDGRRIVGVADPNIDVKTLITQQYYQLAGGAVLASTKALTAADAAIVRDAKTFKDAFIKVLDIAKRLEIIDFAHQGCGAAGNVRSSIENPLAKDEMLGSLEALDVSLYDGISGDLNLLSQNKNRRLDSGFYNDWSSEWHADYMKHSDPSHFLYLKEKHDDVHGHEEGVAYFATYGTAFGKEAYYQVSSYRFPEHRSRTLLLSA